jgi:hypothetical protein
MPLIVLAATVVAAAAPVEMREGLTAARNETHRRLAASSSAGTLVPVAGSSHDIQLDQPQALVDAVRTVLQAARAATHPRSEAAASGGICLLRGSACVSTGRKATTTTWLPVQEP